jgi:hypothetical protein
MDPFSSRRISNGFTYIELNWRIIQKYKKWQKTSAKTMISNMRYLVNNLNPFLQLQVDLLLVVSEDILLQQHQVLEYLILHFIYQEVYLELR